MYFYTPLVLAAAAASVSATPFLELRAATSCSTSSGPGFCQVTSTACTGGTYVAGACPGAANNQCCVAKCSPPAGSGVCTPTSASCSGTRYSGYCPGPSDVQCCVGGTGGGGGAAGSSGIDVSGTQTAAFWSCAAQTYTVAAIRGYSQACGSGGAVPSNFVTNYRGAKNAGVARIDAYLFPCTGTQPTGVACKSIQTQLNEFLAAVDNNGMTITKYWFDIEPTSGECNAWNLGATANANLARQWVAALKSSGRPWGIYANGNQWTSMFATRATDIGSDLPLWAVQFDRTPGVNTVTTFMGGWTTANAKQYNLDTTACGGSVDLDSFL